MFIYEKVYIVYRNEKVVTRSKLDQEAIRLLQEKTVRVNVDGVMRYATPLLRTQHMPTLHMPKEAVLPQLMALFHCMVRFGSVRYGSGRFAFPLQFSTAIEWVGLFTRRYNCAASTAVTSS